MKMIRTAWADRKARNCHGLTEALAKEFYENDGFYIKLVGIFEGKTLIEKGGIEIC